MNDWHLLPLSEVSEVGHIPSGIDENTANQRQSVRKKQD
jgi:hypothetical protein